MKTMGMSAIATALLIMSHVCVSAPFGVLTISYSNDTTCCLLSIDVQTGETSRYAEAATPYMTPTASPFFGSSVLVYSPGNDAIGTYGATGFEGFITSAGSGTACKPGTTFDESSVAYVRSDVSVSNEDVLHVYDFSTLTDTPVYTTPLWGVDIGIPRISPDGSTLAFALNDHFWGSCDIYTMPFTGGVPQELTELPENARTPSYSPDGSMMTCVAPFGGSFSAYIATSTGTNPQRIDLGGEYAFFPCFSPDSGYIATCSDNGINIIDAATRTVVQNIPMDYQEYYGLAWHLGARPADGSITKMKVTETKAKVKTELLDPTSVPTFGAVWIDRAFLPFSNAGMWTDKKGKKYIYKDKAAKRKASVKLKSEKGKFSAKNLALTQGTDYRVETPIQAIVNMGDETIVESLTLDRKGKYKAAK